MDITEDIVKKVASVARLQLTPEEIEKFTSQLQDVLQAFSQVREADTDDAVPSIQPVVIRNALRADVPGECLSVEKALSNAYHKKDSYFKGPKVLA